MIVLAVGCHPDDLEIACSGTLRKYVEQGAEVHMCHVANGNQGHVIIEPDELRIIRTREAEEGGAIIGAKQVINLDVPDMEVNSHNPEIMDAMADATGMSEETIRNMRNDPERVFPIQGIVAFCIALHLSPETSRAYITASPSKFLNNTDMKLYQYALAQWYDLPVSVVNRRLVEAGAKPLTSLVDGYDENGVRMA